QIEITVLKALTQIFSKDPEAQLPQNTSPASGQGESLADAAQHTENTTTRAEQQPAPQDGERARKPRGDKPRAEKNGEGQPRDSKPKADRPRRERTPRKPAVDNW